MSISWWALDLQELAMFIYYTDPSGTFWQCNAKAIGSGSEGADSSLQEQYSKVSIYFKSKFSIVHFLLLANSLTPIISKKGRKAV